VASRRPPYAGSVVIGVGVTIARWLDASGPRKRRNGSLWPGTVTTMGGSSTSRGGRNAREGEQGLSVRTVIRLSKNSKQALMRIREACDGVRSTRTLEPHWRNIWSKAENARRSCRVSPERMRLRASELVGPGVSQYAGSESPACWVVNPCPYELRWLEGPR
jgi:hypothetical protein